MASAQENFDAGKMRREIFQARNRNIKMVIKFVAETAKILQDKGRKNDFEYIVDRSIELLQGNLRLKTVMLLFVVGNGECREMLKYYLELEKLFSNSVEGKSLRMTILLRIGKIYVNTSHYSKTIEYTLRAEKIADELKDKSSKAECCEKLGNARLYLGEYKDAIDYFNKGLEISTEIGDRSGIARNNGNLGTPYRCLGQYEKAIQYYNKSLEISTEIGDRSGIARNNGHLGSAYRSLGQYEKAIQYYNKSLEISTEIGDRLGIARNNGNVGTAYRCLGQYEKAIHYSDKGLEISTEIGDRSGIAINNGNLGMAYSCLGQYEKAIQYYNKSLEISIERGDRLGIVSNNGNLGTAYCCLGQYEKAIQYYNKSLEISTEIGNRSGIANINGNLGKAYLSLGQYEKAIQYCNKGLEISTEIGDRSGIANINGNLGSAYRCLGQYEKAIQYYNKGLEISTKIGDRSGIASNNGNLGTAYLRLGQYEKSIQYCHKGLEISTEIGDQSGIAGNSGNLGSAYRCLGHHEKAIQYYNKSLEISTEIGDQSGIASDIGNLGTGYLCLGQYEKAIHYYNKGLEISTEIEDRSGIAINIGNLSNAYSKMGQFQKSLKCFEEAFKIILEIGDRSLECISLGNMGGSYLSLYLSVAREREDVSNLKRAVSFLKRSVMCGDMIVFDLDVDKNKISFTSEYFIRYLTLMYCFLLLKRIEAALLVIDLGKAKALHAFFEKRKKSEIDDMVNYTRETWKNIEENEEKLEIDNIEKVILLEKNNSTVLFYSFDHAKLLHIWVLNGVDDIKHILLEGNNDLTLPETSIFDILKMLLQTCSVNLNRDSSLVKLSSNSTSHRHNIIAEMPWSQMLLNENFIDCNKGSEYCKLENSENKLSKKAQSCESILLPNTRQDSDSKIKNVLQVVQRYDLAVDVAKPRPPDRPPPIEQHTLILQELFQKLINPVKQFIKGNKWIIVPDKFLFFVPFCALKDENGSSISQNYSIQITPSLHTLFASMNQSPQASLGFALFVGNPTIGKVSFRREEFEPDPLPFATAEAQCLAPLFDAKPLVEDKAVKQRVLQLIQNAGIIHIAAHGEGEHGEIFLAPNPNSTSQGLPKEESYLVREKDIIEIPITARLIVLCCCHTGRGKVSSEGVVGLARAFLAAGARSVLATLWPIDDEGTQLFMENFYKEICNETSVCEALRRTMNIFQQHEDHIFRDLQVWAPFTIYGEDVKFSKHDIEEIKTKSREMTL